MMPRPKPPKSHTRKLRELVIADLRAAPWPNWVSGTKYQLIEMVLLYARKRRYNRPLPHGTVATYLRLRTIKAPGALTSLSAALRGDRRCPPRAVYAPSGWAEYVKDEAAKAAKERA